MSWFGYVDTLCKSGGATKALICENKKGTIWSETEQFLNFFELEEIVEGMKDKTKFFKKNPTCNGEKIRIIKMEFDRFYGLISSDRGICIVKTNLALIIAYFEKPIVGSHCCLEVEKIKMFLEDNNY